MAGVVMKWFRFYHDALDDPKVQRLPGDTFKFWINMLCLASQSDERGLVMMDVEEIAFATRLDDEEAARLLADLIKRQLIEETAEGYQIHNWDKRQFKSDDVTGRVSKHRNSKKIDSGNDTETLGVTLHGDDETLHPSVITDTESETESDTQQKRPSALDQRFDEFWAHYPRKEAKGAAKKAWARIKPSAELTARMIDALEVQKRSAKWREQNGQFIPHPATWLNAERWEDQPSVDMPTLRRLVV